MSGIELIPTEIGREWVVKNTHTIRTPYGNILVYKGFKHDKDTLIPNFPDSTPPIAHDFLYWHRCWSDGSPCTRKQADKVYWYLNRRSTCWIRRRLAPVMYRGLRLGGGVVWSKRPEGVPIPPEHRHLYGLT
jgi:hypothetical protein